MPTIPDTPGAPTAAVELPAISIQNLSK